MVSRSRFLPDASAGCVLAQLWKQMGFHILLSKGGE